MAVIKVIITDIEGTTSSLSFVKNVLFPYSRKAIADFVRHHGDEPKVSQCLAEAQQLCAQKLQPDQLIEQLIRWIDEDKKITPLKSLQGMIWEAGYRRGDFQGHIYEDAVRQMRAWHEQGIRLFVFSSGSVQAQRLLFGHSTHGDLTGLFSGYFDTTIGNKREPEAYQRIIAQVDAAPEEILFLSDIPQELDAASAVGMQTVQLAREGEASAPGAHRQARTFDDICVA
jgi:enolase-phosphatase E1